MNNHIIIQSYWRVWIRFRTMMFIHIDCHTIRANEYRRVFNDDNYDLYREWYKRWFEITTLKIEYSTENNFGILDFFLEERKMWLLVRIVDMLVIILMNGNREEDYVNKSRNDDWIIQFFYKSSYSSEFAQTLYYHFY